MIKYHNYSGPTHLTSPRRTFKTNTHSNYFILYWYVTRNFWTPRESSWVPIEGDNRHKSCCSAFTNSSFGSLQPASINTFKNSSIHVKEQISRAIRNSKKIEGVVFKTREAFLPKKMWLIMKVFLLQILPFLLFGGGIYCQASTRRLTFVVNTIYDSSLNATLWS